MVAIYCKILILSIESFSELSGDCDRGPEHYCDSVTRAEKGKKKLAKKRGTYEAVSPLLRYEGGGKGLEWLLDTECVEEKGGELLQC